MKILHVTSDNIFLKNALEQFNKISTYLNEVFVWSNTKNLQKIEFSEQIFVGKTIEDFLNIFDINDYPLIVLHSLNYENAQLLNALKLNSNSKVIWMLHGYEFYTLSKFKRSDIYSTHTINQFLPTLTFKDKIKPLLRPILETFKKTKNKTIMDSAKKVDYIGILYSEEYEYVKNKLNLEAKWFPFTYYPLENILPQPFEVDKESKHILIGNSASETSNHINIFDKLKKIGLNDDQKIVTPLSYGNPNYAEQLITLGNNMFGSQFMPLTEFMKLEDYNKILSTCSITIMNHFRQQAVGTVLAMVYSGSKVFLSEKNTLYHYLKRIGVHIASIENGLNCKEDLSPLNEKQRFENKSIVYNEVNTEVLLRKLKENLSQIVK